MFGTHMRSEINPKLNEIIIEANENLEVENIHKEVKDKIDVEQEKQKKYYDKGRRPARQYTKGELIKITKTNFNNDGKSKKLLPSYTG